MTETDTGLPAEGHNTPNRVINFAAIRDLHNALLPLETQMQKLRDEMRQKRQMFKSETGMALADFDAGRRLAMIEDEIQRDTKLYNLRTVYDTLAAGEQLGMFDDEALEMETSMQVAGPGPRDEGWPDGGP